MSDSAGTYIDLKGGKMRVAPIKELTLQAARIRRSVLATLVDRTYGHVGGSMSIVEVLAVLYGGQVRYRPSQPDWSGRDYVVLSKGHSGPALYSTLALAGYFPTDWLTTLNDNGTRLPSHPDRLKTPGVDATTGSLGQGISVAAGIALGLQLEGTDQQVFLIAGDGELNEGQCWEAFQFIASRPLDNLIVYIDHNKRQLDGFVEGIIKPFDIAAKMEAFGFYTQLVDGADVSAIWDATERAREVRGRARAIVLDTVKGQGIRYFEDLVENHSVRFGAADYQAAEAALAELDQTIAELEGK